ncbi:MAG: hypothetical protein AMS25_12385 [Gemmatimonas sp. SM23_52]|jgi:hypothetical protein|nr:MAG: hypothetical protein AMS25_12385 [Gemmatimonas sp. SM23_52]
MNGNEQASVADLYQTDLDRHLFAWMPRQRRPRPRRQTLNLAVVGHWLGAWLVAIRTHWRATPAGAP